MKQIIIKSKLSEDDVLKKAGLIQKELLEKKFLQSGDEIVADYTVSDDGKEITLVINGDILSKDKYKALKDKLLEIGEVTKNDLKNFDDEDDHDKEKSELDKQKVDVALTLHDSSELLINKESNMSDLKTLLFSNEEIAGSKPAKPADQPSGSQTPDFSKIDANGDGKISKEEWIAAGLKEDDFTKADTNGNGEITKDEFEAFFKSETKAHDTQEKPVGEDNKPKDNPETHDATVGLKKEDVIDDLKKLLVKKAKGENLSVTEKFFCDGVSKLFTEDELKEMEHFDEKPSDKKCYKVLCPMGSLIKDGFESAEAAQKYIDDEKIKGATVAECNLHDAGKTFKVVGLVNGKVSVRTVSNFRDAKEAISYPTGKGGAPKHAKAWEVPEGKGVPANIQKEIDAYVDELNKKMSPGKTMHFDDLLFDLGNDSDTVEVQNFDSLLFDIVGDKFDKIDTNKDGKISKEEWIASGLSEDDFINVDTNKDGEVSKDEYKAFVASKSETYDNKPADPKPEDNPASSESEKKDGESGEENKPKVETPVKPEKPETQMEMIKRLNATNKSQTLEGKSKEINKSNK